MDLIFSGGGITLVILEQKYTPLLTAFQQNIWIQVSGGPERPGVCSGGGSDRGGGGGADDDGGDERDGDGGGGGVLTLPALQ